VAKVLAVVIDMFSEDALFPTIDQVAERSGLSLRSLYRYFADPSELVHAAIEWHQGLTSEAAHLSSIGEGPLGDRIDAFVAMRVGLYESFGPAFRATLANAHRHALVAEEVVDRRQRMRTQFEQQFAPELTGPKAQRTALLQAGDVLTQLETVHLMASQGATSKEIRAALVRGLGGLLAH
jgi:AcrR family transcriptional regulator